jgi:hypothetical protein
MLLAEIHGKRFPDAEGQEDWLTSSVFGHLRLLPPALFWPQLLERASNASAESASLSRILRHKGIQVEKFTSIEALFWRNCPPYGEPDVILRFTGPDVLPLIVLIEVKLNSEKSSKGEKDQLAKYLALLDDQSVLPKWSCERDFRCIIYLTRIFEEAELEDSLAVSSSRDARTRLFGLEWRDVLEVAAVNSGSSFLLAELADFLRARGFEAFRGFRHTAAQDNWPTRGFYHNGYFCLRDEPVWMKHNFSGRFYGL